MKPLMYRLKLEKSNEIILIPNILNKLINSNHKQASEKYLQNFKLLINSVTILLRKKPALLNQYLGLKEFLMKIKYFYQEDDFLKEIKFLYCLEI
jgi:hypothetical protein